MCGAMQVTLSGAIEAVSEEMLRCHTPSLVKIEAGPELL